MARAYAGTDPATGRAATVSETLPPGASEDEAQAALARVAARARAARGDPRTLTVASLVECYLGTREEEGMSPTTLKAYRSYFERHVRPRVGRLLVSEAGPAAFSRMYRELRRPKGLGGAGLSPSTVRKVHAFLSGCYSRMARDGVVESSPVAGMSVPGGDAPEAAALPPEAVARLDGAVAATLSDGSAGVRERSLALAWRLALYAGLRRGELCGLQGSHLRRRPDGGSELRVARVLVLGRVAKSPKSRRSRRLVPLDDATARLAWEHAAMLRSRVAGWGPASPLLCDDGGRPIAPDALTRAFSAEARRLGLPAGAHLHTLRHTHATYLIAAGEDVLTVRERLGHQSAKTTMDIYGHVLPGRGPEAAARFAAAVRRAGEEGEDRTW